MRNEVVAITTVYAHTVQVGDVVNLDGTESRVTNMFAMDGGRKRLHLANGQAVTLDASTPLIAKRATAAEINR
ncbi:hypothetical protein OK074_7887 [Actinobacteria bacterium OK074]|nr:hypothetical protein OK074_7887 [Actinobacteria bacterium OK074]